MPDAGFPAAMVPGAPAAALPGQPGITHAGGPRVALLQAAARRTGTYVISKCRARRAAGLPV